MLNPRIIGSVLALVFGCGKVAQNARPDANPCTPGAFVGCSDPTTAVTCNSSGEGTTTTACAAGCNAGAGRCNECAPNAPVCFGDGKTLAMCDATGLPQLITTCSLSCVDATATAPARCAHIVPPYLPNVCDALATSSSVSLTGGTIDPGLDASCTAIVSQANGPDICVVRADTISIANTVIVAGASGVEPNRAIAFVADHDLVISGTIDLSAHGFASGPGGGAVPSGVPGAGTSGGGGAGAFTAGGAGANDVNGDGGLGGAATLSPLAVLMGGARAASCSGACTDTHFVFGGGGGGALALVSCQGRVTLSGTVISSGGGGQGARTNVQGTQILAPQGGGAGGNVVIAGVGVIVTGSLFANGGGGGGGCNNQASGACPGGDGGDGLASLNAASGGTAGTFARGGVGGVGTMPPGVGLAGENLSAGPGGGGGGAAGHFQVYAPQGTTPTITPVLASPPFDPLLTIATE
jgi:hypothetical protein